MSSSKYDVWLKYLSHLVMIQLKIRFLEIQDAFLKKRMRRVTDPTRERR